MIQKMNMLLINEKVKASIGVASRKKQLCESFIFLSGKVTEGMENQCEEKKPTERSKNSPRNQKIPQ